MTSVNATYAQIPANKLYVNIASVISTIVDSNNNPVPWAASPTASGVLQAAGAALFRDMGRTVYLPNPTVATSVGSQSTILRRVQFVTPSTAGAYGTGDSILSVSGSDTDYYCGYIRLGGQTYGGGGAGFTPVARLN